MIVWLASYPRSGNTFFRVILNSVFNIKTYSLYDDKSDIGADEKTSEIVGHQFLPENFDIEKARDEEKTYYLKTHELLDDRIHDLDKVIYLIRDGRESTLSFTKHLNIFSDSHPKIIDTIYGNTFIGGWGDHVSSWNPKERENTLLVTFEELIKKPIQYIEILSDFLQIKPVGDKIPTFDELKKINPKFFRTGKTNAWEDTYTEEDHLSFWFQNYPVMDQYGYTYKKPDHFDMLLHENILEREIIKQNHFLINLSLSHEKKQKKFYSIIQSRDRAITQKEETITQKEKTIKQKEETIKQKEKTIKQKDQELQNLYNSKKYKLGKLLTLPLTIFKTK